MFAALLQFNIVISNFILILVLTGFISLRCNDLRPVNNPQLYYTSRHRHYKYKCIIDGHLVKSKS